MFENFDWLSALIGFGAFIIPLFLTVYLGLNAWKSQFVNTRKLEIYLDLFDRVYELNEVYAYIRYTVRYIENMEQFKEYIEKNYKEYVNTKFDDIPMGVIVSFRMYEKKSFIDNMWNIRKKLKFYFKDRFEEYFKKVNETLSDLHFNLYNMNENEKYMTSIGDPELKKFYTDEWIKSRKLVLDFATNEDDVIRKELDEITTEIETVINEFNDRVYKFDDRVTFRFRMNEYKQRIKKKLKK